MVNWKTDFGLSITLFLIGGVTYCKANQINDTATQFPTLVAIGLLLTATILLISSLIHRNTVESAGLSQYKNVIILALILIVYAISMPVLGFILSSLLTFYTVVAFLGEKNKKTIVIADVCTTAIVYAVFHFLLQVPLPVGFLGI